MKRRAPNTRHGEVVVVPINIPPLTVDANSHLGGVNPG